MDIITSIASKIGELLVEPTGRQLGYLIFYQGNIQVLAEETNKLKVKRADLQGLMDAANRNCENIKHEVMNWISEADEKTNELERFLEDVKANKMCLNGWCPNLNRRYSLGRKTKKSIEFVLELQQQGNFGIIAHPAPPTAVYLLPSSMKAFNSRTRILKQVMETLRDENMHVIAICGMGGIGKTTMAKEVAQRAKEEKLFSEVAIAVASQTPNVMKIQGEIADPLGLRFNAESATGRAGELYNRIKGIDGRILIIIDDIWEQRQEYLFDLQAVGIPCGSEHPRCTILLTSRSEDACKQMKSQKTFTIHVLPEDERWNLFEEVAGTSINTDDLRRRIAKQIMNECGGLPVAIVTVGSALKDRSNHEWNEALFQLQQSISKNITGLDDYVYKSIEMSYNFLTSKEAKECFLLCCLFPENYDISIETLARYGKGLRLFQGVDTMEKARSRVHSLVQTLKRCFLLIHSDKEECAKMHDVVRDVAVSIASGKENGFVVRCDDKQEEWPEIDTWEDCTAFSIASSKITTHPDSLTCPKLKLLRFQKSEFNVTFSETFFQRKNELKVVDLSTMNRPLPLSLQVLQNIRTLLLERCTLEDISAVGVLAMLEILSLSKSSFNDLSREIGNLQHLKLLDTRDCFIEETPTINLAGLTRLEELYLGEIHKLRLPLCRIEPNPWRRRHILSPNSGLHKLGPNVLEDDHIEAGLSPLSDHLKVLDVHIEDVSYFPQKLLSKKQTRFRISVCTRIDRSQVHFLENILSYHGHVDGIIKTGIHPLLKESEILELIHVRDLENILTQLDVQDGLSRLKVLTIKDCLDMEYLINLTSDGILEAAFPVLESLHLGNLDRFRCLFEHIPARLDLFRNLKIVTVHRCKEMNYVFMTSLAKGFPQLQSLSVDFCPTIEEIACKEKRENDDNTADDTIIFPKLTYLKLDHMRKLISLCSTMKDNKVEHGRPSWSDIDTIPKVSINEESTPKVLVSSKCMKWLIPSVEKMELGGCPSITMVFDFQGEVVVDDDDQNKAKAIMDSTPLIGPRLNMQQPNKNGIHRRCLGCLPVPLPAGKAKNHTHGFTVQKPQQIKQVSPPNNLEMGLQNLEELFVQGCNSLEVVFNYGDRLSGVAPSLNKLRNLSLGRLPKLMHIWNYKAAGMLLLSSSFQNLRVLKLEYCGRLQYILSASIAKLLVMLEEIILEYCVMVEVVVSKEEQEQEENKRSVGSDQQQQLVILFPQLRSIWLRGMAKLSCFCSEPYAFQFPSLEKLEIEECPKFQTHFREASTAGTTTKPKQVTYGDLNTTIHHNFLLKEKLRQESSSNKA